MVVSVAAIAVASAAVIVPVRTAQIGPLLADRRNHEIVDHPALVPARFIVDDEEPRDVREDVDERAGVVRIGR